ncbi:serine/threonine-protein kinase [Stenotrophomonas lactitubi]|uniref:serine/threonine-protein kinase n=1 Tax=Stenotrophomonas lactitubi TaxID=2045214 RepID=UPI00289EAA05|nr:serine/threonine-protein kinase [Stenotrophomonas lactitubi]
MYQAVRMIGSGGFGNVEEVVDASGARFARKTFSINQPLPPEFHENILKRFQKEIRIQSLIRDRNIVRILSADLDANPPCYIMPLAAGRLSDDIATDRTLSGRFISALADIVAGLEAIHAMQIYHRDLKPQNVLRFQDPAAGADYYAISDFGLISLQESQLSVLTSTGMSRGADGYTAPEVTQDLRLASVQSDIYSLGCILHDFVGGGPRIPCAEIHDSGPYAGILRGCTRRDPNNRFRTARSVLDAVLSVGAEIQPAATPQAHVLVQGLISNQQLSLAEWKSYLEIVEMGNNVRDVHSLFMALSEEAITQLCALSTPDAVLIATQFAEWVARSIFNFDYCDGLANRLEKFYDQLDDFGVRSSCLVALLKMGTSHNRWYVERKFARLAGPEMDGNLAARLAIELHIIGSGVCATISHLEHSINISRDSLHPRVFGAIREICG